MEANYEARKQELLDECTAAPQVFDRITPRLERFLVSEARRGNKWTPAITVQQIRKGISDILHPNRRCDTISRIRRERRQRLLRNELARLYHWKRRNRLAPLNISKRQI